MTTTQEYQFYDDENTNMAGDPNMAGDSNMAALVEEMKEAVHAGWRAALPTFLFIRVVLTHLLVES